MGDVMSHGGKLGGRRQKVAGPGPDQDVDGNLQALASLGDGPGAGGRSTDFQVVAELDSIGTSLAGREGRFKITCASSRS